MMVKEKKCLQDIVIEMYWNEKFTWNFLQFKYIFNNINNLVFWRFQKTFKNEIEIVSFGHNMKKILLIKVGFKR